MGSTKPKYDDKVDLYHKTSDVNLQRPELLLQQQHQQGKRSNTDPISDGKCDNEVAVKEKPNDHIEISLLYNNHTVPHQNPTIVNVDSQEAKDSVLHIPEQSRKIGNTSSLPTVTGATVYISGVPLRYCTETIIEKIMIPYGTIKRITVHTASSSNVCYAFCEYNEASSATVAINALHNRRKLGGQYLIVRPANNNNNQVGIESRSGRSVTSSINNTTTTTSSDSLKRQGQHIDSKIEAIKRKLAKHGA